jgi:hypothetical protein
VFGISLVIHIWFVLSFQTDLPRKIFAEAALGKGRASDFFGIYQGGANLVGGENIYMQDLPENREHRVVPYYYFYRYLPPMALISGIISILLSPWAAYWIWVLLNEALLLGTVVLLLRWKRWLLERRLLVAALWLAYFPLCIEQYMGQFSLLMAVLLVILWYLELNSAGSGELTKSNGIAKYRYLTGVVWSANILIKIFPVMFVVPYLRDRKYKLVGIVSLSVGILSAPYFLWHPESINDFLKLNLGPFAPIYTGDFGFQNFLKVLFRSIYPISVDKPLGIIGSLNSPERLFLAFSVLIILGLAFHATYRLSRSNERCTYDMAIWILVYFLIYKTVWEYHYLMLLPAITALILVTGSRFVLVLGMIIGMPSIFGLLGSLGVNPASQALSWPVLVRIIHFGCKAAPTFILFLWIILRVRVIANRNS